MKKERGINLRLVGTKPQITATLRALATSFQWKSNQHFYPRIGEPGFYSYYLENFEFVVPPSSSVKDFAEP
jgi:hypothetical protein